MKINAHMTISRRSDNMVCVTVQCTDSRVQFLELEFTPHDFGMMLTGLSCMDATVAEVHGLENVGKKRVTEQRSVICPLEDYDRKVLGKWLEQNCEEEGYTLSTYLGSQNSVMREENGQRLNYSVSRFEPIAAIPASNKEQA